MRPRSTSTGSCCPIAPAAACCCRSSARPMAKRWKRARSSCATTPSEGSFSAWYFEHRLPIAPERYSEILRTIVKEAGAEHSPAGQRILDAGVALQGTAPSQSQGGARLQGRVEGHRRAAPRSSRAGSSAYRAGTRSRRPDAGAASSAGTPALQARPLAARLQRHQLSPLLRRQYARRAAGRGCRHFRRHPSPGQDADRGGQAAGAAARSHRWPARSRAIFPAAAPPDPRSAGQTPPSRFTW